VWAKELLAKESTFMDEEIQRKVKDVKVDQGHFKLCI